MTAKKMTEISDADSYAHVAVNGKKSAGIVSDTLGNRIIDADQIQQEQSEIRPRICEDVIRA